MPLRNAGLIGLLALPLFVTACQDKSGGSTGAVSAATPQTSSPPGSMRLISGAAPLQYMLTSGGVVRVVDVTANEQLLKGPVPPQTMIRIDPKTGLSAGKQNIIPGPLPQGHRYEIWLDRQ